MSASDRQCGRPGFDPWVGKIPWRKNLQPTPLFLPRESCGQRSLAGYSPQDRKESELTVSSVFQLCLTLRNNGLKHARFPCPITNFRSLLRLSPLSQWCHPTISSSVVPFSSCFQSFPATGSFLYAKALNYVARRTLLMFVCLLACLLFFSSFK